MTTTIFIILGVLAVIVLGLGYTICRGASKLHPDPKKPDVWLDDEGNEYIL